MKGIRLIQPGNLRETLEILPDLKGPRYFLAGGTDLLVQHKDGVIPSSTWIDLSLVKELKGIRDNGDEIWIGAMTTYDDLVASRLLSTHSPPLVVASRMVGGPQIRARGTIGGNLGNASPAADSVPPLYSLGARVILRSAERRRVLPIEKFFKAPRKSALQRQEIIEGVTIPKRRGVRGTFLRVGQRSAQAISKVSVAVSVVSDRAVAERKHLCGFPSYLEIAFGAVAPTVVLAKKTTELLKKTGVNRDTFLEALSVLKGEVSPIDDIRSRKDYRLAMCAVLLERAFLSLGIL